MVEDTFKSLSAILQKQQSRYNSLSEKCMNKIETVKNSYIFTWKLGSLVLLLVSCMALRIGSISENGRDWTRTIAKTLSQL